jgi:hypothetical protein
MNCEQARELAALAASNDLTPEESRAFADHTAHCAECLAEADAFLSLNVQMTAMKKDSASDAVYSAVRARVMAEIQGNQRPGWFTAWPAFLAVAVCTVILMIALRPEARISTPPVEAKVAPPVEAPEIISGSSPGIPVRRPVRHIRKAVTTVDPTAPKEPLVVKMLTNDADVVIYWIADAKRSESEKEIIQ